MEAYGVGDYREVSPGKTSLLFLSFCFQPSAALVELSASVIIDMFLFFGGGFFGTDSPLHHHHVPLPVRRDVRRPRPRLGHESLRLVDGADGEKAEEETIQ